MAEITADSLETILRQVAAVAPEPWYPKLYAESSGVPRDSLDMPLEKLRLANLIRLTEWVQQRGQGYVLTPEGVHALQDGREISRVRDGKVAPRTAPAATPKNRPRWTAWDRGEQIREVFLDPPNAVVAKTILFVNVLLFLAGMYAASRANVPANVYLYGSARDPQQTAALNEVKREFGAVWGPYLVQGQWWRLLTYSFVHHGLLHILLNMSALYTLSRYLEPMWGKTRFLTVYLIAAWGGGCLAMALKPLALLGGASGALCGLIAAEAVWIVFNRAYLPGQLFSAWVRNIGINAILIVIISSLPNVSAAGHFGGAALGAVVAVLLHVHRYASSVLRWLAIVGVPLAAVVPIAGLLHFMNTTPQWVMLRGEVHAAEAQEESRALREFYRTDALAADQAARDAYNQALPILKKEPGQRLQRERDDAIDVLSKTRADLIEARRRFGEHAVGNGLGSREAFDGILSYIDALADLSKSSEELLRANSKDETFQALEEAMAHFVELQKKWARYIQ